MSGRRVGDFLDALTTLLPSSKIEKRDDATLRLAVVGRPNVGKSSFVNSILGQDKLVVTDIPGTTRDAIDTRFRYKNHIVEIIDTAGLRKRSRVKEDVEYFSTIRTMHAIQKCHVAIILIDAQEGIADQDKKIIMNAVSAGKGIVIGVNKWDLIQKNTQTARAFELDLKESLRDISYIPIIFISALTKLRIFKLLDIALSVFQERNKQLATAELNRFLEYVIQKHHPPAFGDKWVKINYMTQTKTSPPTFTFFTNEPSGIKKNYKYFLENQLRQQFGFWGVPVRLHFRKKN
jgi:GTP-binding protein